MKSLFTWIVATPFLYYFFSLTFLAIFSLLAIRCRGDSAPRNWKSEWLFLAVAGLMILIWRCPALLWPQAINTDEGQWAACALKASVDLAPWRGFDGTTSGPLNSDILAIPALFGASITFFSTRLIGSGLLIGSIFGLYFMSKWTHGACIARLSVVPGVTFLALTGDWDFLHYSSEYLPVFLTTTGIAAAVYLGTAGRKQSLRLMACAIAGLCLGSAAFAKLQSLPIALAAVAFMALTLFSARDISPRQRRREAAMTLAALSIAPGWIGLSLWVTGLWNDAVISYLKSAVVHVSSGKTVGFNFFMGTTLMYPSFVLSSFLVILAGAIVLRGRWNFNRSTTRLAAGAFAFLLVSLFVIVAPRHPYPHYLLFSIVPLSYCTATVASLTRAADLWRGRDLAVRTAIVAVFVIPALSLTMASPSAFLGITRTLMTASSPELGFSTLAPLRSNAAQVFAIKHHAPPGSRISIWGWMPQFYVLSQTIMATRDAHTKPQLTPGPYREYFRERYLSDLRASHPLVFVDAVAPASFGYNDRAADGMETFPALASFIHEYYELKAEMEGVRVFVAKEH